MSRSSLISLILLLTISVSCQNFFWSHTKPGEEPITVKYGLLYNWYVTQGTGAASITSSDDWVVSTESQWVVLSTFAGGDAVAGDKLKDTGILYWDSPNTGATNEYEFNARGSGYRESTGLFYGDFQFFYCHANNTSSRIVYTIANSPDLGYGNSLDNIGACIRLIYIGSEIPTEYVGNDGKRYRVVAIGTSPVQYWLADNLCETRLRNGDVIPWYGANPSNFFTDAEWAALTTAGVCAYSNNINNVAAGFAFPTP